MCLINIVDARPISQPPPLIPPPLIPPPLIPPPLIPPPETSVWYNDGADNPIANQYFDTILKKFVKIPTEEKLRKFSTSDPTKIIPRVDDTSLASQLYKDEIKDFVTYVEGKKVPPPAEPQPPVIQGGCDLNSTTQPLYHQRYRTPAKVGIKNMGNTCWIASTMQALYAMKDIRNFYLQNIGAINLLPEPLRIVGVFINGIHKATGSFIMTDAEYNMFFRNYSYQLQKVPTKPSEREEGEVEIVMATFYSHLKVYVNNSSHPVPIQKLTGDIQNQYNLNFKHLGSFAVLQKHHYFFDTSIVQTDPTNNVSHSITRDDRFGTPNRYILNNTFSIDYFGEKISPTSTEEIYSTKDLILRRVYPSLQLDTGVNANKMKINRKEDFVHSYKTIEYTRIPKYIMMVVHPFYDDEKSAFRKKKSGGTNETDYKNHINICFSVLPGDKIVPMTYFLTSIICFIGSPGVTGHFVTIRIGGIGFPHINYELYNDDWPNINLRVPSNVNFFPANYFTKDFYGSFFTDDLYPYILVYERFSDRDNEGFLE